MSATTNYDMSAENATISSSEISKLTSIYIPRVYANISTEFVADTFESLNLGVVDRVEAVARPGDKTTYMAFVYFASWNTGNKAAVHLAERINTPGGPQARIVYDDPWYWILLPNKSQKPSKTEEDKALEEFNRSNSCIPVQEIWEAEERRQKREEDEKELLIDELEFEEALNKQELETHEKLDLLYDMIEDLQVRLKVSEEKNQKTEKKIERLQKELYDVRTILLTGEPANEDDYDYWTRRQAESTECMSANVFNDMDDEMPSSPPKLVRQNAFVREVDQEDFYIPSPPKLVRQTAISRRPRESDMIADVENGMMTPLPRPGPLVRQTQMPAGPDFIPPNPDEVQARMSAEIAAFQKMKNDWETETGLDWVTTRIAEVQDQVKNPYAYIRTMDKMGLMYPSEDDKNFWCDP